MDVPEIKLKLLNTRSSFKRATPTFGGHAARTKSPEAIMAGFRTDGQLRDGPLEEEIATTGEGLVPRDVILKSMLAFGSLLLLM